MTILSDHEIQQRLDALRGPSDSGSSARAVDSDGGSGEGGTRDRNPSPSPYRFVRPLDDAATALVDVFRNTDGRFKFGLRDIDLKLRGIGKGEMAIITGFAHSGKTQLVLQAILNNRHLPVLWFSPDETREQVLAKLVSMVEGTNGALIEQRVKDGDRATVDAVKRVAHRDLQNLIVVDEILDLASMAEAAKEAESYFGTELAMVGLDYIGLLAKGAEYGDMSSSSKAVKRWIKSIDRPGVVIHQGSRGGSGKGKQLTMQSMAYAGEAEATFVLGVRRKFFDEGLDSWERAKYERSLTVQVLKNKRVSGGLGECDYSLDLETGRVGEWEDHEAIVPVKPAWTEPQLEWDEEF